MTNLTEEPVKPSESHAFTRLVFLKGLGLIYLLAFASLLPQIIDLIGTDGLSPAGSFLQSLTERFGDQAPLLAPSLFWLQPTDVVIQALCLMGLIGAFLTILGILPAVSLLICWICYLSLVSIGMPFLSFQWDALLLEVGFISIFFAPWQWHETRRNFKPPALSMLWLLRLVLFKLMFLSGLVKWLSGDAVWQDMSALEFHYQTQPLPHFLSWYAHHLPTWVHRTSCLAMFLIELILPFFIFFGRRLRSIALFGFLLLQVLIVLTGNYGFFNWLTIVLCLVLLDDGYFPRTLFDRNFDEYRRSPRFGRNRTQFGHFTFCVLIVLLNLLFAVPKVNLAQYVPDNLKTYIGPLQSLRIANSYGLFSVMTKQRPELIIEGSIDGSNWQEYHLAYKPNALDHQPKWVAPYQPRLDWQMWFAALGNYQRNPWLVRLCEQILKEDPGSLSFFSHNPFPESPPRFVRVVRYRYRFANPEERRETGAWWHRDPMDIYLPSMALRMPEPPPGPQDSPRIE